MRSRSDFLVLLYNRERYMVKPIRLFFCRLYGVGKFRSKLLMLFTGLNRNYSLRLARVRKSVKFQFIDRYLAKCGFIYGYTLRRRRHLLLNIRKDIYTYKAMRRSFAKPCRGQRTHSNASTAKKYPFGLGLKIVEKSDAKKFRLKRR